MTTKVQFATVNFAENLGDFVEWVRRAEDVGFDVIGYGDSQNLWADLFVALTLAAQNTRHARIGSMVTNPMTRHPAISAGGMASIQQLAGGRAFYGIGSGDSALLNIGVRAATRAELEAYCLAFRNLCAGEQATWQGQTSDMKWHTQPVPIWLSAEGPRMLDLAGRIADGVIVGNGVTTDVVEDSIARIRRAAEFAGRNPDEIELWWMLKVHFAPSEEQGWRELGWSLAGGNKTFRSGLEGKFVPEALRERVLGLVAEYDSAEHARPGAHNAKLVEKYDLFEFLGRRFTACGPPERIVERIQEITEAGATNLILVQLVPDKLGMMQRLSKEIFPAFK
jgi:5,10-methylenetetrahydromethanopterin reductase